MTNRKPEFAFIWFSTITIYYDESFGARGIEKCDDADLICKKLHLKSSTVITKTGLLTIFT